MSRYRGSRSYRHEGDAQNPLLAGLALVGILAAVAVAGWWIWNYSRAQDIKTPLAVGAGLM
jgi:hypothetical protein